MKVVIFCGGLGVRMGEATQRIPKPMIPVGTRPILWHIMKWYASWGHTRLHPLPRLSGRDDQGLLPELRRGARRTTSCSRTVARDVELLGSDISDWTHHLRRHGRRSRDRRAPQGRRAAHRRRRFFLATYGDGLTDAPLDDMIESARAQRQDRPLHLRAPGFEHHVVEADADGVVLDRGPQRRRHLDQWRLLRFPPRDSRRHRPDEELVDRAVRTADRAR